MTDKILVVDDQKAYRSNLRGYFERRGFEVEAVSSGEEALARVESAPLDLMILDIKLPGPFDGLEVLRRIRQSNPRVCVVVMTGYPSPAILEEVTRLRADEYLPKPFDLSSMQQAVEKTLTRQRLEDELIRARGHLESLYRLSPLAMFALDPGGAVSYWGAESLLGYSESEIVGRALPPALFASGLESLAEGLPKCLAEDRFAANVELRRKDGGTVRARLTLTALADALGRRLGFAGFLEPLEEEHGDRQRAERSRERQQRDLQTFAEINRIVAGLYAPETLASLCLAKVLEYCHVPLGALCLRRAGGGFVLLAHRGAPPKLAEAFGDVDEREPLASRVLGQLKPALIQLTDYPEGALKGLLLDEGMTVVAGIPLVSREQCIGILYLANQAPHEFRPSRLDFLGALGREIAFGVGQARRRQELMEREASLEQKARTLEALYGASQLLARGEPLEAVLRSLVQTARVIVGAKHAALGIADENHGLAQFIWQSVDPQAACPGRLPQGLGLLGKLLQGTRPLRVEEIRRHPDAGGFPLGHAPMRSFLGVPLISRGRTVGSFYMTDKLSGGPFTEEDEELLSAFGLEVALLTENARLREDLSRSREHFEDLFDNAPDMYYRTDLQGHVLACNRTMVEALGLSKEEIVGKNEAVLFDAESRGGVAEARGRVLESGEVQGVSVTLLKKGGGGAEVLIHSRAVYDEKGHPVEIRTSLRDVSESRKLEQ